MYWRYQLTEEVWLRTVRGKRGESNRISIYILQVITIVMKGATVLMRGENSSAVQCVPQGRKGGKSESRGTDEDIGALETKRGWCFQAKHVRGVDNSLADEITRRKERIPKIT